MTLKTNELINSIKVNKNQWNAFGKYSFRNNEDIQTALKPMLLAMNLQEESRSEIVAINGEIAIAVHIKIFDPENPNDVITGDGYAVIDVNKKGMDKSQATGASQSYASKYAYGQALKLDDVKDADSPNQNTRNAKPTPAQNRPVLQTSKKVMDRAKEVGYPELDKLKHLGDTKVIAIMKKWMQENGK